MSLTVNQVLKVLADEDIEYIIQYRESSQFRRTTHDDPTKSLTYLCDTVSANGLSLLIANLDKDLLQELSESENLKFDDSYLTENQKPSTKLIAKRLLEKIAEEGAKNWLTSLSQETLEKILDDCEINKPSKFDKAAVAKTILNEANNYGLQNLFSTFTSERLRIFAENSGLEVAKGGRDVLIECLIERKSIKPEKPVKRAAVKVSKNKPAIKKGITAVDLNHHFYLKDLKDWLSENDLPDSGSKKILIKRILDHFDGKDVSAKPKTRKRKAAAPKKKPAAKKARTDSEEAKAPVKKAATTKAASTKAATTKAATTKAATAKAATTKASTTKATSTKATTKATTTKATTNGGEETP